MEHTNMRFAVLILTAALAASDSGWAQQATLRGQVFQEKGKLSRSLVVEQALKLDPDYVEARNELGACYAAMKPSDQALQEFRKVLELDPAFASAYVNSGLIEYSRHRYPEAEAAARKALALNPNLHNAHYLLGLALKAQNQDARVVLENLKDAAFQYPGAHLAVAEVLATKGHQQQAAREVKKYLDSGAPEGRQAATSWLARLQEPPDTVVSK